MQTFDGILVQGPSILEGPLYPMSVAGPSAEAANAGDGSTASDVGSVSLATSAGAPSNADGQDGMWCLGADGHLYFKTAGAWTLKL